MSLLLWMLAVAAGMVAAVHLAQRDGLDPVVTFWGALGAALAGIAGGMAWTWSIVHAGLAPPPESGKLLAGDLSVLGAIAGIAAFAVLYLRSLRRPPLPYLDIAVTAGLLAYAIGRLGCFFNGCCFGTVSELPWAVHHGVDTAAYAAHLHAGWIAQNAAHAGAVHPVALYHSAAGFLLFCAALGARAVPGRALALAAIGYPAARFVLQFFRGDASPMLGGLDVAQVFCLGLLVAGIAFAFHLHRASASAAVARDAAVHAAPALRSAQPSGVRA